MGINANFTKGAVHPLQPLTYNSIYLQQLRNWAMEIISILGAGMTHVECQGINAINLKKYLNNSIRK